MAAITPILLTVISLVVSVFYFKVPLYLPLIFGYSITFVIAVYYRRNTREILKASYKGIRSILMIVIIMVLIGILIAVWASSGTIDALVYYGLTLVHPDRLVVLSFLISSAISMLLGTSVGTMSTVGVALLGIATNLGIHPSLVAGALVSGAFVGDRTSPLSSAAQMNAVVTGSDYHQSIRELLKTLLPSLLITAIIYFFLQDPQTGNVQQLIETARIRIKTTHESMNPWLLLPPFGILLLAIFKVSTKRNLGFGIILGMILAYIFQDLSWYNLIKYSVFGYPHMNGTSYGGGLNMLNQVLLIIVAGAYLGTLEESTILSTVLKRITDGISDRISLVRNTMIISILSAILSSTQVMAIIVPGRVLGNYYLDYKLERKLLNRMISDSGMVVAGLIPWNLNAVLLAIALNISVLDYLPYAYLLMILPVYSYFQFRYSEGKRKKVTEGIFPKATNN